jgi:hypothetical protein
LRLQSLRLECINRDDKTLGEEVGRKEEGFRFKSVVMGKESSFQVDKKRGKEGKVERYCESSPASIPSVVCVAQAPD